MSDIDFKIEGMDWLERALYGLGADLAAKTLRNALMDSAEPMRQEMIARAPESDETRKVKTKSGQIVEIRPGFYKSRIKKRSRLNRKGAVNRRFGADDIAIVQVGVFKIPYAGHIEFGTSDQAANPVIRPAGISKADEVVRGFSSRLATRIEKARRKLNKK